MLKNLLALSSGGQRGFTRGTAALGPCGPWPVSSPNRVVRVRVRVQAPVPRRPGHPPPALGEHVDKQQRQSHIENQDEQHQLLAHEPILNGEEDKGGLVLGKN